MLVERKVIILKLRKASNQGLNEKLQWFGSSLGLFGERDKDKSCFRLFVELLKAAKKEQLLSSDELAEKTNLSRGTAVHHLNRLMEIGIVSRTKRKYSLRAQSLAPLVEVLKRDFSEAAEELEKTARELDAMLGL